MNFENKKAIVTGTAGSIGREIALGLARQGATVLATDLHEPQPPLRSPEENKQIYFYKANVEHRLEVQAVVAKALEKMGGVDILVNVAGVVDQRPYDQVTTEEWDLIFDVNVRGTFYFIQEVTPLMGQQKQGKIVNFSSKSGKTGSAFMVPYSAAKAAIIGLTQALACELAPLGINVNAVCPGITENTGVWKKVSANYQENLKLSQKEVVEKFTAKVPLGRLTRLADIVGVVLFLCSQEADYLTGQAINITGGREMH